jgi:DNA-binding MarR family transcriptional regulator
MAEPLQDRDYQALAEFRLELRRFLRFSEQAALAAGIAPQQHQALLALRASPGSVILIGELAERLLLRSHSASELVDRLEAAGLVRRLAPDGDRRQVRIGITPAGEALLASLSAAHREELRRIEPLLRALRNVVTTD